MTGNVQGDKKQPLFLFQLTEMWAKVIYIVLHAEAASLVMESQQ